VQSAIRDALASGGRTIRRAAFAEAAPVGPADGAGVAADRGPEWGYERRAPDSPMRGPAIADAAAALLPAPLFADAPPTVLGQHRNTYIVATDGEDLILVDQHTAHERVRFEALMDGLGRGAVESQMLLVPVVITLPPRLRPGLDAHQDALRGLGFEAEPFGGDAVRVAAVPAMLGGRDPGTALETLLADLIDRESSEWAVTSSRERLAATLACHSAARGGQPLAPDAMRAIVAGLWSARHPSACPHGRPTRVRVPRDDVSRWFRRTGWRRE
jgi:DNA mismatch repair protein MutL